VTVGRIAIYFVVGCALLSSALIGQSSRPGKTADQVYKNIQVLRNSPAEEIMPSMQFMSSSLGVRCDHCHVEGAFDKDEKKPKQQAREMMKMVSVLNQNNFAGQRGITCYTCHHGALSPRRTPEVLDNKAPRPSSVTTIAGSSATSAAAMTIIDRYLQAIGGASALSRITSEVKKGTMELSHGVQFPIEIAVKQPDKRSVRVQFPNGQSVEIEDGQAGWSQTPGRPIHSMSKSEATAARTDADPSFIAGLKQSFAKFETRPDAQINGNAVSVVRASNLNQAPVRLFFDKRSGLLVRLVRYVESPLGRNPTQVDYADYREVAGVQIPFRWTAVQPQGQLTVQLSEVQVNVQLDDSRFAKPPSETAIGGN
jgi:outer membrane lipoprotein-sorting protein